jgi:photosystem II stability/assembly factor-like uncharacterized protein
MCRFPALLASTIVVFLTVTTLAQDRFGPAADSPIGTSLGRSNPDPDRQIGASDSTEAAQIGVWRSIGPAGGEPPRAFAAHPSNPAVVYAAAAFGVLKSTDGGRSWSYSLYGFGMRMESIAIHPHSPNVIVAGGPFGVMRSTDAGATWQSLGTEAIDALTFGGDGTLFVAWVDRGLMKSTNNGGSWVSARSGIPTNAVVFELARDPNQSGVLYAAAGSTLFRTTNSGSTWSATTRPSGSFITALSISTNGVIFVGSDGISRSVDGGQTWTRINSGLPPDLTVHGHDFVTDIALGASGATLYVSLLDNGIYRTTDGLTWHPSGERSANQQPVALVVQGASLLAASAPNGISRSEDGGLSWTASNAGLAAGDVRAIGVTASTLYAAEFSGPGLFASSNDGASWTALAGLPNSPIMSLAIWQGDPRIVYAGTGGAGVWKSSDGGSTWQPTALGGTTIHGISIDAQNPSLVFAMSIGGSVYRSSNGGATWTDVGTSFNFGTQLYMRQLSVDPTHSGVVYLGAEKAYVSRDSGTTWSVGPGTERFISASSAAVYALVGGRVMRSTDAAVTWMPVTPVVPNLSRFIIAGFGVDESTGDIFLALTDDNQQPVTSSILRSAEGGAWETLPLLAGGTLINTIVVGNRTLYVGTAYRGAYAMTIAPPPPAGPRRRSVRK